MKMVGAGTLGLLASIAAVFSVGASAQEVKSGAVPQKEFEAKLAYCQTCHSIAAQGFRGSFPIPRLAGQQPTDEKFQMH